MPSSGRKLVLDGLDRLREMLDEMAQSLPGWMFQMGTAYEPHPENAIQVEGYCKELKLHAAIVIYEAHIADGTWVKMMQELHTRLERATYGNNKQ